MCGRMGRVFQLAAESDSDIVSGILADSMLRGTGADLDVISDGDDGSAIGAVHRGDVPGADAGDPAARRATVRAGPLRPRRTPPRAQTFFPKARCRRQNLYP